MNHIQYWKSLEAWGMILLIMTYGFQKNSRKWHSRKTKWVIHTPAKSNITSRILNVSCAKLVIILALLQETLLMFLGFKFYYHFSLTSYRPHKNLPTYEESIMKQTYHIWFIDSSWNWHRDLAYKPSRTNSQLMQKEILSKLSMLFAFIIVWRLPGTGDIPLENASSQAFGLSCTK